MWLRIIGGLALLGSLELGVAYGANDSGDSESAAWVAALDSQVEQIMEDWRVPGGVVIVIRAGEVVLAKAYGVANPDSGQPVDVERTVFRFASISKPVTASAVMRLHQLGELDLHIDVEQYLPGLAGQLSGAQEPITTAHLLTHTAGFEDRFLLRMTRSGAALPELEPYLSQEMPRQAFPAGEISLYSNHGVALAGLVVEKLSDAPFVDAARKLVFEPLGMENSSFELEGFVQEGTLAQGHRFGQAVSAIGIKTVPASMLASTGADMGRFMQALLVPEGSDFLDRATVDLMFERHFEHHPSHIGRAYGFSEDSSVTPRRLFHSGSLEGFTSGIVLVPEAAGGALIALNGNAYVWGALNDLLTRLWPGEPTANAAVQEDPSPFEPEAVAGRFVPAELPSSSFDKARVLFEQTRVSLAPDGALLHRRTRYQPRGAGVFVGEGGPAVVLQRSAAGPWLLLEQGAAWRRIPWHLGWPLHLFLVAALSVALGLQAIGGPPLRKCDVRRLLAFRSAAVLELVFLVGTGSLIAVTMSQGGGVLRFGVPWYLRALLTLPLLALVVTAWGLISVLRSVDGERGNRTRFAALLCSGTIVAFTLFLAYWRMLGFQF